MESTVKPDRKFYINQWGEVTPIPLFCEKPVVGDGVALEDAIAKWQFIVDNIEYILGDGGTKSCALCSLYFWQGDTCSGCPIREHTDVECCEDTPYSDWYIQNRIDNTSTEKLLSLAKKEVEFLTSLREEVRERCKDEN